MDLGLGLWASGGRKPGCRLQVVFCDAATLMYGSGLAGLRIAHIVCAALSCTQGMQPKILRNVLGFVGRVSSVGMLIEVRGKVNDAASFYAMADVVPFSGLATTPGWAQNRRTTRAWAKTAE